MKKHAIVGSLLSFMVLAGTSHGDGAVTKARTNAPTFRVGDSVQIIVTDRVNDESFRYVSTVLTNGVVRLYNAEGQVLTSVVMSNRTQSAVIWPVLKSYGKSDFSTNFTVNITATNRPDMPDFPVTLIVGPEPNRGHRLLGPGDFWTPEERLQFRTYDFAEQP